MERLTKEAAARVRTTLREARKALLQAQQSRARFRGVSRRARERAIQDMADLIPLAERVLEQARQRFAGEKISDRLVSLFDANARPIRRGKLARPNEFGYVVQLAEVTAHTKPGARGLILPPKLRAGSVHENTLLSDTVDELVRLGLTPKEAAFDAGFGTVVTPETMARTGTDVFIAGAKTASGSRRRHRRLGRYRVGCEGRISHLKREYGADRTRLKGGPGAQTRANWAVFSYDLDTAAKLTSKRG